MAPAGRVRRTGSGKRVGHPRASGKVGHFPHDDADLLDAAIRETGVDEATGGVGTVASPSRRWNGPCTERTLCTFSRGTQVVVRHTRPREATT